MITLDNLKNLDDLEYAVAYEQVENYPEGEKAAIDYFKKFHIENEDDGEWTDDMVYFHGPEKIRFFDKKSGSKIETTVYECYTDPGSVDCFYFSYTTEL
jgi:hypothetical protein